LNVVNEIDVVVVLTLVNCILRLKIFDSEWENCVSDLVGLDFSVEGLITVLALDVGHFVWPPHDGSPV
jgi:hypothetical protein